MKIPYEVIDRHADMIGGERVEKGIVNLSDAQAEHWLRVGTIRCLSKTFEPGPPARHPLDHDGDGRPGGSLPGRKRGRPRKAAADEPRGSPTNFPAEDPLVPPKPYLPVEDDSWEG
jgi:hypothetical protein